MADVWSLEGDENTGELVRRRPTAHVVGLQYGRGRAARKVEGFEACWRSAKGAKAVVASLWPVVDESTALLMREFYRIREADSTLTKLHALREAQLELLHGMTSGSNASQQRGLVHDPVPPSRVKDFSSSILLGAVFPDG